jgi:hypothetical protein
MCYLVNGESYLLRRFLGIGGFGGVGGGGGQGPPPPNPNPQAYKQYSLF